MRLVGKLSQEAHKRCDSDIIDGGHGRCRTASAISALDLAPGLPSYGTAPSPRSDTGWLVVDHRSGSPSPKSPGLALSVTWTFRCRAIPVDCAGH